MKTKMGVGARARMVLQNAVTLAFAAILAVTIAGCSSEEILPDKIQVEVSREKPSDDCLFVGPVSGSVSKIGESADKALANMKIDAARKGANYVYYETSSAAGTGLKGTGYFCE